MVQILAIPIAVLQFVIVNAGYFDKFQGLYFIPISLLVVPVIYAALLFGFAGSFSTAVWVVVLSIPNLVYGSFGLEKLGALFQLALLVAMAFFIGQQVDRENNARNKMQDALAALTDSERRYRSLFDSSTLPIFHPGQKQSDHLRQSGCRPPVAAEHRFA